MTLQQKSPAINFSKRFFDMSLVSFLLGILYFSLVGLQYFSSTISDFALFLGVNGGILLVLSASYSIKQRKFSHYMASAIVDIIMSLYLLFYMNMDDLLPYFICAWLIIRTLLLIGQMPSAFAKNRMRTVQRILLLVTIISASCFVFTQSELQISQFLTAMTYFGFVIVLIESITGIIKDLKARDYIEQNAHKTGLS